MASNLTFKRILVLGGSGVLGSAISARFHAEGVQALGVYDLRQPQPLEPGSTGHIRVTGQVDVTDAASVDAAVDEFVAAAGGLDVVVNNVGVMTPPGRLHNTSSGDLRTALEVNVFGVFHGMKSALRVMRAQRSGTIVNTASISATTGWTHSVPYSASKAAVLQLTRTAALEYAREGIRVNSVSPGTFVSGFHDQMTPEGLAKLADRHAMGRLAEAEEIAGMYVYLAGDDASFVTGTDMRVDGGLSAW